MGATDRPNAGAKGNKKQPEDREERLQRLRQLIASRGEDAARVLQMWMQRDGAETDRRRRPK